MTAKELEARWQGIDLMGIRNYRSLLLSHDCIPDIYISRNAGGERYLILQVPDEFVLTDLSVVLLHLSMEVLNADKRIVIGLHTPLFADLFNDLVISLYEKVKNINQPQEYVEEFSGSFYKWTEFFESIGSSKLSKSEVQGLFGELLILRYLLLHDDTIVDDIVHSWQGPYGKPQDFSFNSYDLEVKTIEEGQATVRISSEYQLQAVTGKGLQLAIATIREHQEGMTLGHLSREITEIIRSKQSSISRFLKTLLRAGIVEGDCSAYDNFVWQPVSATFYDCNQNIFPKIIASDIPTGISQLSYQLSIAELAGFDVNNVLF